MIHVAVTRTVRAGREQEFEAKLATFFAKAEAQRGAGTAYLIRGVEPRNPREYGILRSFESPEDRRHFYDSPLYREWTETVKPLVEGEAEKRELHGLEAFFRHPSGTPPATWKMAFLTWLAVNPAVYVFSRTIPGALDFPELLELLIVNVFVVASLAWVLMPALTRVAGRWVRGGGP